MVGSGPITATLTWDTANSDVDLHVFEPNGAHVYYAQFFYGPTGSTGLLDVDAVLGFGPEHYYTDCNQLQVGEYKIGVNYYAYNVFYYPSVNVYDYSQMYPARSARVSLTVSVPGSTRTFSRLLINANYGSLDMNPELMAKVIVEQIVDPSNPNINGKLKYKIVEY